VVPLGWRLSAAQWDLLTETLQLERYPAPIQVRSHGRTALERSHVWAEVAEQLRRLGMIGRGGWTPISRRRCGCCTGRRVGWTRSGSPTRRLISPSGCSRLCGGTVAVCAVQEPDQAGATTLDVIPVAGMAAAVVSRLPSHPPGRDHCAGPRPRLGPAGRGGGVLVSAFPVHTERQRAAVSAILDQPHARAGQIAANVRDRGRVRRSPVLRWCDNPDGRYQITVTTYRDDTRSLTVAPCDRTAFPHMSPWRSPHLWQGNWIMIAVPVGERIEMASPPSGPPAPASRLMNRTSRRSRSLPTS
jgi:hypothetical protein